MEKQIGVVGVDSGQLMLCDPCYLNQWSANEFNPSLDSYDSKPFDFSYDGVCRATLSQGEAEIQQGVAVAFGTAFGDGVYPVYAEYDSNGTIRSVRVDLQGVEDEDEDA